MADTGPERDASEAEAAALDPQAQGVPAYPFDRRIAG
jgi:hypothetical protein